jgi:hypothetical protein
MQVATGNIGPSFQTRHGVTGFLLPSDHQVDPEQCIDTSSEVLILTTRAGGSLPSNFPLKEAPVASPILTD